MGERTDDSRIRLVLFDELGLFRSSLARLLASEPGFEIVGECGDPEEALEILQDSAVDLVLLDFGLETVGNDFISAARHAGYKGRLLIVAGEPDARSSALALKLGASGIFLKSAAPNRLVRAIRLVANGDIWVDEKVIKLLADQLIDPPLDHQGSVGDLEDRERKVLVGILGGLSNKQIGDNVGFSESLVKAIVQRLFAKACVRNRSQLVRVVLEGSLRTTRQIIGRRALERNVGTDPPPAFPPKEARIPR